MVNLFQSAFTIFNIQYYNLANNTSASPFRFLQRPKHIGTCRPRPEKNNWACPVCGSDRQKRAAKRASRGIKGKTGSDAFMFSQNWVSGSNDFTTRKCVQTLEMNGREEPWYSLIIHAGLCRSGENRFQRACGVKSCLRSYLIFTFPAHK